MSTGRPEYGDSDFTDNGFIPCPAEEDETTIGPGTCKGRRAKALTDEDLPDECLAECPLRADFDVKLVRLLEDESTDDECPRHEETISCNACLLLQIGESAHECDGCRESSRICLDCKAVISINDRGGFDFVRILCSKCAEKVRLTNAELNETLAGDELLEKWRASAVAAAPLHRDLNWLGSMLSLSFIVSINECHELILIGEITSVQAFLEAPVSTFNVCFPDGNQAELLLCFRDGLIQAISLDGRTVDELLASEGTQPPPPHDGSDLPPESVTPGMLIAALTPPPDSGVNPLTDAEAVRLLNHEVYSLADFLAQKAETIRHRHWMKGPQVDHIIDLHEALTDANPDIVTPEETTQSGGDTLLALDESAIAAIAEKTAAILRPELETIIEQQGTILRILNKTGKSEETPQPNDTPGTSPDSVTPEMLITALMPPTDSHVKMLKKKEATRLLTNDVCSLETFLDWDGDEIASKMWGRQQEHIRDLHAALKEANPATSAPSSE